MVKILLGGLDSRLNTMKVNLSDFEDRQWKYPKQADKKCWEKIEQSLIELWDIIKRPKIYDWNITIKREKNC